MSEPKPDFTKPPEAQPGVGEERTRVHEALGDGLRKFYDSVLEEPIPTEWLALFGAPKDEEAR